jgi:hypothetical protein
MLSSERETLPDPVYMKRQTEITENLRATLIDWLVGVHLKFKLKDETLFLTVNLIDRYLSIQNIAKTQF